MTGASAADSALDLNLEITLITSSRGTLSKTISLVDGVMKSDGSGCRMSAGEASRQALTGADDLAALIAHLEANQAIALGRLDGSLDETVKVMTKAVVAQQAQLIGVISRSRDHIDYAPNCPAFMLLDIDTKDVPTHVRDRVEAAGGLEAVLAQVLSALDVTARVVRSSTSSHIANADTGERFEGSGGLHIFLLVQDGGDILRAMKALHDRLWLADLGWFVVGKAGQLLERSLIDQSVSAPERLVFEAAPTVLPPLRQETSKRAARAFAGTPLDTQLYIPDPTPVELARLDSLRRQARAALWPEALRVRALADSSAAQLMSVATGRSQEACIRLIKHRHDGLLAPGTLLEFDDPEVGAASVGQVLADVAGFTGQTLADPMEGIVYGRNKAMVLLRSDGWPFIHSFAHGRQIYELQHDLDSIRAELEKVADQGLCDRFIVMMRHQLLSEDEIAQVVKEVSGRSGVGLAPIKARLKSDRAARIAAQREHESFRRAFRARITLAAPDNDGELTPTLEELDALLAIVETSPRPMRDINQKLVSIAAKSPDTLHELSSREEGATEGSLPAPSELRIVPLDVAAATLEIEKHVGYERGSHDQTRAVRLQAAFVDAYLNYSASVLPIVRAVATAPLVTLSGDLLMGDGLDVTSGVYYDVSLELRNALPVAPISDEQALAAWVFLTDKWLVDLATDITGKAVAIAYALTVIERVLLPERPAFFFTAAQRAAGKTTTVNMLVNGVLGHGAPAAAWTDNKDERRKALMALLVDGGSTVVWDNIRRGSLISCPHIEAALTSSTYSDRILGSTRNQEVSAQQVFAFTGNNIGPKGDLASRSLVCTLSTDRIDPENRAFAHSDPIGWTRANRSRIVAALYTLLLWQPVRGDKPSPPTRFKTWWLLIGQPLETVSALSGKKIIFAELFASVEGEDEEGDAAARAYQLMLSMFGYEPFTSAQVAGIVSGEGSRPLDASPSGSAGAAVGPALKAALADASGSSLGPGAPTAHQIGKCLQRVVNRPVCVDGDVLRLTCMKDRQHGNRWQIADVNGKGSSSPSVFD